MGKLVCLNLSKSAISSIHDNLYLGERVVIQWKAEEKALKQFNKYGNRWSENKGHSGKWSMPTHRHKVTLHWRFLGVENNIPVFEIGLIECEWFSKQRSVFKKFRRWIVITIGLLGLLTMLLQTYSNLNAELAPIWEFVTVLMTLMASFFYDK